MLHRAVGPPDARVRPDRRTKGWLLRRSAVVALLSLAAACWFGGAPGIKLGVPFFSQEQPNYCTAASVEMWVRYVNQASTVSQTQIFNWEGGAGCTTILRTAQAVVNFSGIDATWDYDADANYYKLISRQAASVSNGEPVIPVVRFNHTGVIDGGQWELPANYYVWDFVYFHDPDYNVGGPDLYIGATDWIQYFCPSGAGRCDQVIAAGATAGWQQDLATYGPNVRVSGGGRGGGPYAM